VAKNLNPVAVALSVRPMRSVLLVPGVAGIPWQGLFRRAFRCHTSTWGGAGNLVLPVPADNGAHDELFWALLDVFDADTFHGLPIRAGDVETLAPDYYEEHFGQRTRDLIAGVAEELREQALAELAGEAITGVDFDKGFQDLLMQRVAPLASVTGLEGFRYDAADPPHWPLTSAEKLRPLPAELVSRTSWPTEDIALLNAATNGEMSPRLEEALRTAGVRIQTSKVNPTLAWNDAVTVGRGASLYALSALGLERHFYPGTQSSGLVLVVGEEPWDFAFACALDRFGVDARWVPTYAKDDLMALHAYSTLARNIRQYSGAATVRVCSTSDQNAAGQLTAILSGKSQDLAVFHTFDPLDLVPTAPCRLYEKENVGAWQTMLVIDGTTPLLPTPIPRNVEANSPDDIHWMTDVDVENWDGARHASLDARMLLSPALMGGTARSGREALSYMSPGVMTWSHRSLASQAVRPKLAPLSFQDQVLSILTDAGWRAEPSDKGVYLEKTAGLFGGTQQLVAALSDERASFLTAFLSTDKDAPGIRVPPEGRRCMTLKDFHELRASDDPDAVVLGLEGAGAIIRGLVLKCAECRATRFYRLADVGHQFRCSRCATEQRLGPPSWMLGAEPPWRYMLAEVVFQFLDNNGDLPLLAAHDFVVSPEARSRPAVRRKLQYTGELRITDPDGKDSELDIVVTDGAHVWIGEATVSTSLEDTKDKETKRLKRFRNVADILGARAALLISSAEWDAKTITRAESQFPGVWPKLEVRPKARRAERWRPRVVQRDELAKLIDACGLLLVRVDEMLSGWKDGEGRSIQDTADLLLQTVLARATRTYRSIVVLSQRGLGEQARMLVRSLFEDMVDAHWIALSRELAVERVEQHQRDSQERRLATARKFPERFPAPLRELEPPMTDEERTELKKLFRNGTGSWTGLTSTQRWKAISGFFEEGAEMEQAEFINAWLHKTNHETLHLSSHSLRAGGPTPTSEGLVFRTGATLEQLGVALFCAFWTYAQILRLVANEFQLQHWKSVYAEAVEPGYAAFGSAGAAAAGLGM
jgi:hypothetical protein